MDPPNWNEWDWWPLARLLITASVLGITAHLLWGWTIPLRGLAGAPGKAFESFALFALASDVLAHLYLVALAFPLYAAVLLNDSFYDASRWVIEAAFRPHSKLFLDILGLGGEILLFGGLGILGRWFLFQF